MYIVSMMTNKLYFTRWIITLNATVLINRKKYLKTKNLRIFLNYHLHLDLQSSEVKMSFFFITWPMTKSIHNKLFKQWKMHVPCCLQWYVIILCESHRYYLRRKNHKLLLIVGINIIMIFLIGYKTKYHRYKSIGTYHHDLLLK